ncbi:ABC transporter ATP-binding protein [Cryobacterium sp. SO2]|uniref:dipeptide ABC transporter ATP-binding protein n=1 Tax=Cryobacterium sp. SO2 TaxID=1897060 RepID=UPI00223C8CCC|nr:ABC transporter ATP-binding protein [Cryobacterium sp. SO2]WEO77864.1 ABC transporter ATP-binding protein [Cryobacterium sp. SO2]
MNHSAPGEALLRVTDLQIDYDTRSGRTHAVRGVDFAVAPGAIVAVVGESGSGKSTISQALVRRLPDGGRTVAGSISFDNRELVTMPERSLRRIRGADIGFVPQDPSNSLNPLMKVGEQIAESLRLHRGLNRADAATAAVRILDEVGIPDAAGRAGQYPHELSGGMRQRVLIGVAWSCSPRLVIADEPTSALDVTVQRHVLDRLETLAREQGTAVILVTHDLAIAADRADHILVMQAGRIVEQGTPADVLGTPAHPYTRELVAAAPGLTSGRLTPSPMNALGDAGAAARDRLTLAFRASAAATSAADILVVDELTKTYTLRQPAGGPKTLTAVDKVSFTVPRGSTFAIVGESGSGKTTTARIAARSTPADSGRIRFDGQDISTVAGEELRQLRRRIQVVYQNPFGSLDPTMSVERLIDEPLRAFKVGTRPQRAGAVRELLSAVRLDPALSDRRPAQLSGGQRQRVAIARALALGPELLVLDEPVSALDVSVQEQILQLLVDLQVEFGLSYLFISHDLGVIRQVSDRVAVMRTGRVIEQGDAAAVLSAPAEDYTRELVASIPGRRRA